MTGRSAAPFRPRTYSSLALVLNRSAPRQARRKRDQLRRLLPPGARFNALLAHRNRGACGCGVSGQAQRAQPSGLEASRVLLLDIFFPGSRALSRLFFLAEVLVGVAYCCAFLVSHLGLSFC